MKGVLPDRGLGQLFGDANVGKSFLAIDLCCHIALGLEWRGHRVKKKGVVYVAAEGLAGLQKRFFAWCQETGEVPDCFWIREWSVGLTIPGNARRLSEDIGRLPSPVGMVVLDTFAGNFGAGSENAAEDMAMAMAGMKDLGADRLILGLHHTGHIDKTRGRGHSSLFAALDVELMLARQGADGPLMLSHTKVRDFDRMAPLAFRIEKVVLPWADEDGEPVDSARIVAADAPKGDKEPRQPSRKETMALDALRDLYRVRQDNVGPAGKPRVFLREWYQALSFEPDTGNRTRLRRGLEEKGFIYCDNGVVYIS